jgi:hypothetical protein
MVGSPHKRIETPDSGHPETGGEFLRFASDPGLPVSVIATTTDGTVAALQAAVDLARDLEARVALVAAEVVPLQFPLDKPPVSLAFIQRRLYEMVFNAGIKAKAARIRICLCRDRDECLRRFLPPRSLIVIGGRRRWWSWQERKLERLLRQLGHHVIFIEIEGGNRVRPSSVSARRSVLWRLQEKADARGIAK